MHSNITQFFSGALDPTWPHVVLIGGSILGGALVGLGVILEARKIFSVPTAAVFLGVVIEAACTLLLFGFDEGTSQAQQSKIISLETQLAERVITKDQYDAIQKLSGVVTDIGIIVEPHCVECRVFASQIERAFHDAGARLYGDNIGEMALGEWSGTGIVLYLPPGDGSLVDNPLVAALQNAKLFGGVGRHQPDRSNIRTDIPVLLVGEKPLSLSLSAFPYFPPGSASWTILPIKK